MERIYELFIANSKNQTLSCNEMKEKLLFTGGEGFLSKNIVPALEQSYRVEIIGKTLGESHDVDIVDDLTVLKGAYEVVLHFAGKMHASAETDEENKAFLELNLDNTKKLCSKLEEIGLPKSLIFVSTLAVYGNDMGNNDDESKPLKAESPYGDSMIQTEQFLLGWGKKHGVIIGILRKGLLAGKDAEDNLGAMLNGIKTGMYASIAGGKARKSILMAEDIARLVPLIADKGGVYNAVAAKHPTFRELEITMAKQLGKKPPMVIPYWAAKCIALVGDVVGGKFPINSERLKKITMDDIFSSEKAQKELGWQPLDVIKNYRI